MRSPTRREQRKQNAGLGMLLATALFMAAIASGNALMEYETFVSDRMAGSYFTPNS